MSVNDINLEDCSLDMAVGALKGAAPGIVRIGVAKPLPSDRSERDEVKYDGCGGREGVWLMTLT